MENKFAKKKYLITLVFFAALVAGGAIVFFEHKYSSEEDILTDAARHKVAVLGKERGEVLGEEEGGVTMEEKKYSGEKYKTYQIGVGGQLIVDYGNDPNQQKNEIVNVESETFNDKNKKDKKVLLSWSTGKPTKCKVEYHKAGVQQTKTFEEESYAVEHAVLLSPLESASTYSFGIAARDKWGNTETLDKLAIYTGAPDVSFLDLIAGAFKDVFGWAMN